MELKDWLTLMVAVSALIVSIAAALIAWVAPIKAVRVGQQLAESKALADKKQDLFLTLFTFRADETQVDYRNVEALNQIEVVFADHPEILELWRNYFARNHVRDVRNVTEAETQAWQDARADLLLGIAKGIGYTHLRKGDVMSRYVPQVHVDSHVLVGEQLVRSVDFYKAATELYQKMLDGEWPPKPQELESPDGQS